jgi:hypothetical protein
MSDMIIILLKMASRHGMEHIMVDGMSGIQSDEVLERTKVYLCR